MSKEVDKYLSDVFVKISSLLAEYNDYILNNPEYTLEDYKEISQDYLDDIEHIKKISPKLKSINSMCTLDDDDIDFVYQCLATYESVFVFAPEDTKEFQKQQEEYAKLSYILDMFSFDDDDEDNEDDEDEDEDSNEEDFDEEDDSESESDDEE